MHLDQAHLVVLDRFMREVLVDVDMLSLLSSADHVVSPFDTCWQDDASLS
jgi:hypothetical protein